MSHSTLSGIWVKLKELLMGPSRSEGACMGGSEYIFLKSWIEGHGGGQLGSSANSAWIGPVGPSCLAGRFCCLQSRISNKIYFEPLMCALSPREGPVGGFFNSI